MWLVKRIDRAVDAENILVENAGLRAGDVCLEVPTQLLRQRDMTLVSGLQEIFVRPYRVVCNVRESQGPFFVPLEDMQEIKSVGEQYVVLTLALPAKRLQDLVDFVTAEDKKSG